MLGLKNIKLELKCPLHDPEGEGNSEEKGCMRGGSEKMQSEEQGERLSLFQAAQLACLSAVPTAYKLGEGGAYCIWSVSGTS